MTPTTTAIAANLDVLADELTKAAQLAEMACEAMHSGHQSQAIGTVLPLEGILPELSGLLAAAIALHRRR